MAISAAQLQVEFRATGAREVSGAIDQIDGKVKQATGGFDAFFDSIQGGAGSALRALDGISRAMGSIALMGGITLVAGGTRAAWQQVDAVQQATVALKAYETNASAVEQVLQELVAYARSDMGVLFQRQDLFAAAQNLKVFGAETSRLTTYVEIMSRSVGVGAGNWDELNRVIGRVISTGKVAGEDFDMLTKMGYQLEPALRNAAVSADELFDALDRGIPTGALEGQANTIRGLTIRIQSAIREIGLAFLQVDRDTSQFIEGGLGDRLIEWMREAPDAIKSFSDAAAGLGNAIVGVIDFVTNMVNAFQMLPGPVQSAATALLKIVTAFGALRVAGRAMGMIGAMTGLGGLGSMLGGGMFRGGTAGATSFGSAILTLVSRINPLKLAIGGVVAVGASWVNSFMEQKRAADDLRASVSTLTTTFETLRRQGMRDQAARGEGLAGMFGDLDERSLRLMDEWYDRLADNDRSDIYAHPDQAELERYLNFQEVSIAQQIELNSLLNQALLDPDVNVDAWMNWAEGLLVGANNAEELQAAVDEIIATPLSDFAEGGAKSMEYLSSAIEDTRASVEDLREIFADVPQMVSDLRIDGLHRQANEIEALSAAFQGMLITQESYWDDSDMTAAPILRFREVATVSEETAAVVDASWQRISDALASGNFDNARLIADIMDVINNTDLDGDAKAAEIEAISLALHEYLSVAQDVLDVLGQSDLTSMLDLAGLGDEAVAAAANINQLAASMDTLFRVVVGNTNAIGSQFEALFKWADDLIAAEGVWSKLDDLLAAGRISGEHGVFTGDSEYARAQQAYNQIAEDNAAIQEHILTIQAKQAPLLAANASAMEEYMAAVADMPIDEQLATLGFMDAGLQSQLGTVIDLAGQFSTMGAEGEAGFRAMAEGIAITNPGLFAMMESIGLVTDVTRDLDGTVLDFEINLDGATTVQDTLNDLIESIDALTVALGGVTPAAQGAMSALSSMGSTARDAMLAALPDRGAATHGDTGVPVVTGLPNTGTGGTMTIDADTSAAHTVISLLEDRLNALEARTFITHIDADTSSAHNVLGLFEDRANELDSRTFMATITADSSSAHTVLTLLQNRLDAFNGSVYTATMNVNVSSTRIPGRATGGFVDEPLTLVGERGPELVSLPQGSYVHTNAETMRMMNSGKSSGQGQGGNDNSIHVSFDGATFSSTNREEMNKWAEEDLIPGIARAVGDRRTGMGAA